MIVVQVLLGLVLGGAILAVGLSFAIGLLAGAAGLVLIFLCIAFVVYLIKANWKPTVSGYYSFASKNGAFVGKPGIAMDVWRLQQGNTCAINAQRMVLAICGIHRSDRELAERQQAYGLHNRSGSTDIQNLMSGYGLGVRTVNVGAKGNFVEQFFYTLRAGRIAVACVNAALLNSPDPSFSTQRRAVPNHVILLTGLRNIGGGKYLVYYTDTGVPDGILKSVDARVMLEAAGASFVETPVLFDVEKRVWPYSPTGLDVVPVEASNSETVVVPCPQCEKHLRFRLAHETRVSCPRCRYRFMAAKGKPDRSHLSWNSSPWDQAGRDQSERHARRGSTSAQRDPKGQKGRTPAQEKPRAKFVEVRATCLSCHHAYAETVLAGPETVHLKCPACGIWDEQSLG